MSETIRALRERLRREALRLRVNPRDVDLLLSDSVGKPLTWLIAHDDELFPESQRARLQQSLLRRFTGEPLQYIRGQAEFYGRPFTVDSRVLIPRPETEFVVEEVLNRIRRKERVLDVGTGSGCIAVTLQLEMPSLRVFACDISLGALAVASRNARALRAPVRFAASDLLSAFTSRFDVIVSNPPYIPAGDVESLAGEVRLHEPYGALTPGSRGSEAIERLFDTAAPLLVPGGFLIFEIGFGQAESIPSLAEARGWEIITIEDDLAAIPRVVVSSPR